MQMFLFGIVAVILFFVFIGVAHHLGAGPLLDAIRDRAGQAAHDAWVAIQTAYFGHLVPAFKRLGWAFAGIMGVAVILTGIIAYMNDYPWWLWVDTLVIASCVTFWIYMNNRRINVEFSIQSLAASAFTGFMLIGAWMFTAAHLFHDRSLAVLGAAYVLMALEVLFFAIGVVVRLAAYGVYVAEGTSNLFMRAVIGLVSNGRQGLLDVFGPGGVQIAEEEQWMPVIRAARRRVDMVVYPVLALGIIGVSPILTGFAVTFGFARNLWWAYLERNGIDTASRRQHAAKSFEVLCYALLLFVAIITFVPGAEAYVDGLEATADVFVKSLLSGGSDAITIGMRWLVGATLAGIVTVVIMKYWPRDAANQNRARGRLAYGLLSGAFGATAVACTLMFLWSVGRSQFTNTTTTLKDDVIFHFVPTADGKSNADRVEISWPTVTDASGYKLERRESSEPNYTTLKDGYGADVIFAKGIKSTVDRTATPEKVYFYRLIAMTPTENIVSKEVRVTIPKESAPVAAPKPTVDPPVKTASCTNGACTRSTELSELCRRYPSACN